MDFNVGDKVTYHREEGDFEATVVSKDGCTPDQVIIEVKMGEDNPVGMVPTSSLTPAPQ